ncbi:hypothetical protein TNCV_1754561 [Trichonephila clavipes]|nr:hypothetical protein TNCV_1754561 [Trichonephila clavipes]
MKTATKPTTVQLSTERVNRNLVQMIASLQENHENSDQFLTRVRSVTAHGVIWKNGRNITVNIDQVRVYRPRQSDTISSDSPVETCKKNKKLVMGRMVRLKGSLKSIGNPLVRKVRGVDHGRVTPHGDPQK